MSDGIYYFNGKDITMNICIQIRDVIDIIKEKERLSFPDATVAFYHSRTYKALQNTENALWAESAGYIADRYFEEQKSFLPEGCTACGWQMESPSRSQCSCWRVSSLTSLASRGHWSFPLSSLFVQSTNPV